MPRVNIAALTVDLDGIVITETAADATNKNMCDPGADVVLYARNSGAGARTVTIETADTVDGLAVSDISAISLAAGATRVFGPLKPKLFARPTGGADPGKVYFEGEHAEVKFAVIQVSA